MIPGSLLRLEMQVGVVLVPVVAGGRIQILIVLMVMRHLCLGLRVQRRRRLVLFLEQFVAGLETHEGRLGIRDLVLIE
jgi:hypothetical protein